MPQPAQYSCRHLTAHTRWVTKKRGLFLSFSPVGDENTAGVRRRRSRRLRIREARAMTERTPRRMRFSCYTSTAHTRWVTKKRGLVPLFFVPSGMRTPQGFGGGAADACGNAQQVQRPDAATGTIQLPFLNRTHPVGHQKERTCSSLFCPVGDENAAVSSSRKECKNPAVSILRLYKYAVRFASRVRKRKNIIYARVSVRFERFCRIRCRKSEVSDKRLIRLRLHTSTRHTARTQKADCRADAYMSVRQRRKSAVTSKRSHSFTICS